jgi:glycosyltransferase involved in cell wall biosynthesis
MDTVAPKKINSFLAVLPTFNEEGRIASTIEYYHPHISHFLIIDNYSTDSTLLIANSISPHINSIQILNQGTFETTEWWQHASNFFSHEYVLFLSCSERIPLELLRVYADIATRKSIDIVFSPRTTLTSGTCTDSLYCKPSSLFSRHNKLAEIARLVRWKAVNPLSIYPHDSFRSQINCIRYTTSDQYKSLVVSHIRPKPYLSFRNEKIIGYARAYAESRRIPSVFSAIADSCIRFFLDALRFARLCIKGDFNIILFHEYLLRVYLHFLVVYFACLRIR